MGRFFKKKPEQGQPISVEGFAKGVAAMAYALEYVTGIGIKVSYSGMGALVLEIGGGTITDPAYVLGKKSDGSIGWVATCSHASQHPES